MNKQATAALIYLTQQRNGGKLTPESPGRVLPPWVESPARLWSLRHMKEYLANRLVRVQKCMSQCYLISMSDPIEPDERRDINEYLDEISTELKYLNLNMTLAAVKRLRPEIPKIEPRRFLEAMAVIDQRFDDEIASLDFFHVPAERRSYYNRTDLFGIEFKERFPLANAEIIEAGNCFALDRFSASVFHLTRAMEIAIRVVFVSLGMPPRIWSATKWSKILDRIKGKIDKNNRNLSSDINWQQDRPFYENAHAFLAAVRVPIRNATVHVETVYDEPGAENVFGAVKTFMRHIAPKLKETP
jgi:hypothetical protein